MDLNLFCIAVIDSTHISLIAKRKIKQLQPAYLHIQERIQAI